MHSLYTDGSHANELNIAGIGGYLLDDYDKEVWTFSNPLYEDQAYHELKALNYALGRCLDTGVKELTCYTDALNIVRDISGGEAKHHNTHYQKLFNDVLHLLPHFKHIEFEFIPREQNKKANLLARKVLTNLTTQHSRVKIYQNINPELNYFKCENLFCIEQFVDKKKINNLKNNIAYYYVFDLYRDEDNNILDIYQVKINGSIKVERIASYPLRDTWRQYINAINQTLMQAADDTVGIMLCPANNEVDLMLRGMKAIDNQYEFELNRLKNTIKSFKRVLIDSNTLIYQQIFQT